MVKARLEEILTEDLVRCHAKESDTRSGGHRMVRQWPKGQIWLHGRAYRNRSRRKVPCAGGRCRNIVCKGDAERLPKAFVITKKECFVLLDRAADRRPKLIPAKFRLWNVAEIVEKVGRVQAGVTEEFVGAAVNLVGAGFGDSVDDRPRGSPIRGAVVVSFDRKLGDRINPQIFAEYVARSAVGIIVDANSILTIIVFVRTVAGIRQLISKAAIRTVGSGRVRGCLSYH